MSDSKVYKPIVLFRRPKNDTGNAKAKENARAVLKMVLEFGRDREKFPAYKDLLGMEGNELTVNEIGKAFELLRELGVIERSEENTWEQHIYPEKFYDEGDAIIMEVFGREFFQRREEEAIEAGEESESDDEREWTQVDEEKIDEEEADEQ